MMRVQKDERVPVTLTINGRPYRRWIEPRMLLSDFLRDEVGLTGTHVGCEHGVCGACTVIIDGHLTRSCLTLAMEVEGRTILTLEGIAAQPGFDRVKAAFSANHALQCGFCTPGIVASVWWGLQQQGEQPVDWDDLLSGHLCRCTGYVGIQAAIKQLTDGGSEPS